jgi:hypothetical protein
MVRCNLRAGGESVREYERLIARAYEKLGITPTFTERPTKRASVALDATQFDALLLASGDVQASLGGFIRIENPLPPMMLTTT